MTSTTDNDHQKNKSDYYKVLRQDLDAVLSRKHAPRYEASEFRQQLDFINSKFYTVSGTGQAPVYKMRQIEEGKDAIKIQKTSIYDTVSRKFLHRLQQLFYLSEGDLLKFVPSCVAERYSPDCEDLFVIANSSRYCNTYIPPKYKKQDTVKARPKLWQEYLDRLIPPDQLYCYRSNRENKFRQQDYFEKWIAQRIQHPEEAPQVALILRGEQGTGKSFWCDKLLKPLVGETNYSAVALADIKGSFIGRLFRTTLVQIEEVNDNRNKTAEKLKPLITQESHLVDEKFQAKYQATKHFGLVLTSNFNNPILIEKSDRRYFIPTFSKVKEDTPDFFERFTDWLEVDGYQKMYDHLHTVDISKIDFRKAPITRAKQDLMVLETSAESNTDLCKLWLTNNTEVLHKPSALVEKFKITIVDAQVALREEGFQVQPKKRVEGKPMVLWKHKDCKDERPIIYNNLSETIYADR